jgi:hypothetical protein
MASSSTPSKPRRASRFHAAALDLLVALATCTAQMLDWFGWRFLPNADPANAWSLEVRPDATPEQRAHFAALLAHSVPPAHPIVHSPAPQPR